MTRRDLYRLGNVILGGAIKLAVAVPALAFIASPLRKKAAGQGGAAAAGEPMETLATLSQLKVGQPQSFPIIRDRTDAWVTYPSEPVGSVWLLRQPEGAKPEVVAFSAECPHLGCAINLTPDGSEFLCPCHTSAFDLEGKQKNQVPPRPMDRLDVELTADPDPKVKVRFQKFRTLAEEKIPLA
ncbi:ubiquinol-cytochrome c reductase iron-sulfur subunit [Aquisphaera insulae]|uniref:QcrA and Rieske domain-containing protein n=1 Tax=Aquisphaera insulae TaxID=2712864 RepID=UPI0013ED0956|nr:Rieske 2Fe-2S domain-containing protein [Aquisphaera insulae]